MVLDGAEDAVAVDDDRLVDELRRRIGSGATRRDASAAVAEQFGVAANRVKRLAQHLDD